MGNIGKKQFLTVTFDCWENSLQQSFLTAYIYTGRNVFIENVFLQLHVLGTKTVVSSEEMWGGECRQPARPTDTDRRVIYDRRRYRQMRLSKKEWRYPNDRGCKDVMR